VNLPPPMSAADLQKLRDEAKRFGRGLTDAEQQWALRDHKRTYFDCPLSELTWNLRIMLTAKEELGGKFFAATEPPAIWVQRTPEGRWHLRDGYHRVAAAFQMGKTHIPAFHE
jgi:hypothetical protein